MSQPVLPPFDAEAEASVLGSLLIDAQSIAHVSLLVEGGDFFREQNRWVYDACLALYEQDVAINQVTVAHELEVRSKLAEAGGAAYLAHLIAQVPTSLHADYYARIVKKTSLMRKLIQVGGQITQMGYANDGDVTKTLAEAESLLFNLQEMQSARFLLHIKDVIEGYLSDLASQWQRQHEGHRRLPTGFADLDSLLGGLHAGDLVVIAARPSIGKSAWLMNVVEYVALRENARVAVFSLEMSRDQLVDRLLSSHSGVDLRHIRLGNMSEWEEARALDAAGIFSECAIWIDDSPTLRPVELRSKVRRMAAQHGLDLLVIDYLQMMEGSGKRGDNRVQEVGEITTSLKALAKELDIPVLAAAQLSRSVEMRTDHRPMLSDLRESGSIEQAADVVMFLYREEMYVTEKAWAKKNPLQPYPRGATELIVAKHRNGPTGQVNLTFLKQNTRFVGVEKREENV